jgi:hypothetical protein
MISQILSVALFLSAQAPAAEPTAPGSVVAQMKTEAVAMAALVQSSLAKEFLTGFPCLPPLATPRVAYYSKEARDAVSEATAKGMTEEQLKGYVKRDLDEQFFYLTRYGTPVAFTRPMEILGRAGVKHVDGLKLLDFGFGSIGQLRVIAALGGRAVGVEVDALLRVMYSEPGDTGAIARCDVAGGGADGNLKLVFGQFPAEVATVTDVGTGYDVFVSKNTLKRGYIHPEQQVDPKMLVHLRVDDETYVRAVYDLLKPGGFALIYNLSPAPAPAGEAYKPWADGRSPFPRELYERVGFAVIAFDMDDSAAAREMGKALGWAESMDLEKDLFGTYTLVRRPQI